MAYLLCPYKKYILPCVSRQYEFNPKVWSRVLGATRTLSATPAWAKSSSAMLVGATSRPIVSTATLFMSDCMTAQAVATVMVLRCWCRPQSMTAAIPSASISTFFCWTPPPSTRIRGTSPRPTKPRQPETYGKSVVSPGSPGLKEPVQKVKIAMKMFLEVKLSYEPLHMAVDWLVCQVGPSVRSSVKINYMGRKLHFYLFSLSKLECMNVDTAINCQVFLAGVLVQTIAVFVALHFCLHCHITQVVDVSPKQM